MKLNTITLAGTAILAALVVVFDYTLRYSNLKIPFPALPFLKFDFTGIPIVLSFLLFGLLPGLFTSITAFVAILARSSDVIGSSMKGLAEFATIVGMAVGLRLLKRLRTTVSVLTGITLRAVIMVCVSLTLIYAGVIPISQSYADIPFFVALLFGLFNVIQGIISVVGGYSIYETIKRRAPSLIEKISGGRSRHQNNLLDIYVSPCILFLKSNIYFLNTY
jgi:riboflavin transporter FmnP